MLSHRGGFSRKPPLHLPQPWLISYNAAFGDGVPEVCRFLGIIIRMYADEHAPPHFHAYYQDFSASFSIQTGARIEGDFPQKLSAIVTAWALLRGKELMSNWQALTKGKEPNKINPLR